MGNSKRPKQADSAPGMFAEGGVVTEPYIPPKEPDEPEAFIELSTEPSPELQEAKEKLVDGIIDAVEKAKAEPVQEVHLTPKGEQDLIDELTAILRVPKTKDALMTFSMFSDKYQKRYFLLDVDGNAYRQAWSVFKERTGTKDQNRFLFLVYTILELPPPRLHRGVDWAPLN